MKVRIQNFKTSRGRCTGVESKIVQATFVCTQQDGSTVVTLDEPAFHFPVGYKIAVWSQHIIEQEEDIEETTDLDTAIMEARAEDAWDNYRRDGQD